MNHNAIATERDVPRLGGLWRLPPFALMFVLTAGFPACSWCAKPGPSNTDSGTDAGIDAGPMADAGDAGHAGDAGDAGDAGIKDAGMVVDSGPPTACYMNPVGYLQIINACSSDQYVLTHPSLPCLDGDGGLPLLDASLPEACLPVDAGMMICPCTPSFSQSVKGCVPGLGTECYVTNTACPPPNSFFTQPQVCIGDLPPKDAGEAEIAGWCSIPCTTDEECGTNGNLPNTCTFAVADGGRYCQLACEADGGSCVSSGLTCLQPGSSLGRCVTADAGEK